MRRKAWWTLGFILIITILAGMVAWPKEVLFIKGTKLKPGLDVQGGTQLVYQLDLSGTAKEQQTDAIAGVKTAIERRVDAFGVAEPVIYTRQISDVTALDVELPGIQDIEQAKNLIGKTAKLEFWAPGQPTDEGAIQTNVGTFVPSQLDGAELKNAQTTFQGGGQSATVKSEPVVQITFTDEGTKLFGELTRANIGAPIAIVLDGQIVSAPIVQTAITDGVAIITGGFSVDEAKQLTIQLNAGALPVPITLIEERTVGATLGTESIESSLFAGLIGFLLVILFMSLYYRLLGVVASVALMIYGLLTIALYEVIGVTFTLAGIAGFLISIGMAVDANVLIFERFKEEQRSGKPVNLAIEEGFRRAWSSIFDSNISSIITAAILYYTATGLVRGFALTLALGIAVSMFTAITVTRTFLRLVLRPPRPGSPSTGSGQPHVASGGTQ